MASNTLLQTILCFSDFNVSKIYHQSEPTPPAHTTKYHTQFNLPRVEFASAQCVPFLGLLLTSQTCYTPHSIARFSKATVSLFIPVDKSDVLQQLLSLKGLIHSSRHHSYKQRWVQVKSTSGASSVRPVLLIFFDGPWWLPGARTRLQPNPKE